MAENFLTKPLGPLPIWGWGLAGAAGVGIALFIRSRSQQGNPGQSAASDLSAGNVLADQTGYATMAGQISPGTPFPTVPVGGGQAPVFPGPGWTPILDGSGQVVGWNPPGGPGTNGTPGAPVPVQSGPPLQGAPIQQSGGGTVGPQPGQYFKGPTGVGHYMATGKQTIAQIAVQLHDNRHPNDPLSIEKLNGGVASTWTPPLGYVLTI